MVTNYYVTPMETPNFVRVVHTRKPQLFFGSGCVVSCVGAHENMFGRVGWACIRPVGLCRAMCGCSSTCDCAKNAKS